MTTVTMIPMSQVRLLNPRARNKAKFSEIVSNIAAVGLKKPITVAPRAEEPGTYDLVCGQVRCHPGVLGAPRLSLGRTAMVARRECRRNGDARWADSRGPRMS